MIGKECLNLGNVQKDKEKGTDLRKMLKGEYGGKHQG